MNALAAAYQVLAQSNEPLSKHEIAKRAIQSGIWDSDGKTPYETIGSRIYLDIKKKGEASDFILVQPGVFALRHPDANVTPPPAPEENSASRSKKKKKQKPTKSAPVLEPVLTPADEAQTLADCAYTILDNFSCQAPMTFKDIAQFAVSHELVNASMPNLPEAILADVKAEILRYQQEHELPRFIFSRNHTELMLSKWHDTEETPDAAPDRQDTDEEAPAPLTFTDCAQKILEESHTTRPMHYRTITAKAIEAGWLVSSSRTPEVSLYAQIITEIKQRLQKGEPQRFIRYKNGFIGLTAWNDNLIAATVQKHNQDILGEAIHRLQRLEPQQLEAILTRLLVEMGFEDVSMTHSSDTRQFDISATLVAASVFRLPMAIIFIRDNKTIDAPSIRKILADAPSDRRCLIIATCDFSPAARDEVKNKDIALINSAQLAVLMAEHAVGIRKNNLTCFEIDNDELNV